MNQEKDFIISFCKIKTNFNLEMKNEVKIENKTITNINIKNTK